jgi:hypothetical protein
MEAAGIETCAAAYKTPSPQLVTLRKGGVRVECSGPCDALPYSCFSSSPYFLLTSSYVG